jgi:predicted transposase YbfD/YdcC
VLAQRKVDEKPNGITAIPKLLAALELAGTVVTIDAIRCQRSIAAKIVEKKSDYVLAVKDNQGLLAEQVRDSFLLLKSDAVAEEIDFPVELHVRPVASNKYGRILPVLWFVLQTD